METLDEQQERQLKESELWDRAIQPSQTWFRKIPSRTALEQSRIERADDELSVSPVDTTGYSHRPFVLTDAQESAIDRAEAFEKQHVMGWLDLPASVIVEAGISMATFLPDLITPNWGDTVQTSPEGVRYFIDKGINNSSLRKDVGHWLNNTAIISSMVPFDLEGDPDGFWKSLVFHGGKVAAGFKITKVIGALTRTGKATAGFKSAEAAAAMSTSMAKFSTPKYLSFGFQEAVMDVLVSDRNADGSITSLFNLMTNSSHDEAEAYSMYWALNEEERAGAAETIAGHVVQNTALNVGLAVITKGLIHMLPFGKSKYKPKDETQIRQLLDNLQEVKRDKFLPATAKVMDLSTNRASKAFKEARDELDIVTDEINIIQLKISGIALRNMRKAPTSPDEKTLTRELAEATMRGDDAQKAVIQAKIKQKHLVNGGAKIKDDVAGTGSPRIDALVGNKTEGISSASHEAQKLADKVAATAKKGRDETVEKLKLALANGEELAEENLIRELISSPAVAITGDDVMGAFRKELNAFATTAHGFATTGGKKILESLKKDHGFTDAEVKNFVQSASTKDEAIHMAFIIREKAKVATREMMENVNKALKSEDEIDIFLGLHSYNKAAGVSQMARSLASTDGAALQAHRWHLEAGELISMKIAGIKAKMNKSISTPIDNPLLKATSEAGDLTQALSKGVDANSIRDEVIAAMGGTRGVADAKKLLTEVRKLAREGKDNGVMNALRGKHDAGWGFKAQQAVVGYVMNNILSSPTTTAKVAAGGIVQSVLIPATRTAGAAVYRAVDYAKLKMGKVTQAQHDELIENFEDVLSESWNLFTGIPEAAGAGLVTAKNRTSRFTDSVQHEYLNGSATGYAAENAYRHIKGEWQTAGTLKRAAGVGKVVLGAVDDVIKTPTKGAMSALDETAKTLHFRASMKTLLNRKIKREKLYNRPNFDANKYIEDEIAKQSARQYSPEGITSMKKAQAVTLQTPLVGTGEGAAANITLEGWGNTVSKVPLLSLAMMFTKTVGNMADETLEAIPFMPWALKQKWGPSFAFTGHIGKRLAERVAGPENIWKKQAVLGKQMAFASAVLPIWQMMDEGIIEGAGEGTYADQDKARQAGYSVPYSLRIGDTKYGFSELIEPIGMSFRVIVKGKEAVDKCLKLYDQGIITRDEASGAIERQNARMTDIMLELGEQVIETIVDASPAMGPQKIMNAATRRGGAAASLFGSLTAMFYPLSGLTNFLASSTDPHLTFAKGYKAQVIKKTKWSHDYLGLPTMYDVEDNNVVYKYNLEDGSRIKNHALGYHIFGIKKSFNKDTTEVKVLEACAPFLKPIDAPTSFGGVDVLPDEQTEWNKEFAGLKIRGKTFFEERQEHVKLGIENELEDPRHFVDMERKKNSQFSNLLNKVAEPYIKATNKSIFTDESRVVKQQNLNKLERQAVAGGIGKGKGLPKIDKNVSKGTSQQVEKAAETFIAPTTSKEAQSFFQPKQQ